MGKNRLVPVSTLSMGVAGASSVGIAVDNDRVAVANLAARPLLANGAAAENQCGRALAAAAMRAADAVRTMILVGAGCAKRIRPFLKRCAKTQAVLK